MDFATLAAAQNYVDKTAQSLGAVKGAPCTIKSITEGEDGSTIVFSWTGADGTEQTRSTFLPRGPQGVPGPKGDRGKDGSGIDTEARKQIAELSEEIAALGVGLSAKAGALLIEILYNCVFTTDQTENIRLLQEALAQSGDVELQLISGNLGLYDSSMLTSPADQGNPLIFMCEYNGKAGSCVLSGHVIERITLEILTAGTLLIGKCSLDNLGESYPVITNTQTIEIADVGQVTFDISPIELGANETIVIKHNEGTARIYGKGISVENAVDWQRAMRFCTGHQYSTNQLTYNIYAFGAFYGR